MDRQNHIRDWLNGKLDAEQEWELDHELATPGPWRDAYNEVLRMFENVHYSRDSRESSLAVAVDEHELEQAKSFMGRLLSMPTPHLGSKASLEAVATPKGLLFHITDPDDHRDERHDLVPYGTETFRWRDRILDMKFTLHEHDWGVDHRLHRRADDLCSLAYGTPHSRALEFALVVVEDLVGYWRDLLASAAHAFNEGLHTEDALDYKVNRLLRLRIHFSILARRLGDPALDFELDAADALLAEHKDGLLLISEREYQMSLDDGPVSTKDWWGFPLLLEQEVPRALVLSILEEMREKSRTS